MNWYLNLHVIILQSLWILFFFFFCYREMFGFGSKKSEPEPAYSVELDSGAHDVMPSSPISFTESSSASEDAELQV